MLIQLPAQEAVNFQSKNTLGITIEAIITHLRSLKSIDKKTLASSGLSKVIALETGLTVSMHLTQGYGAYIAVPDIDRNHTVLNDWRRAYAKNSASKKLLTQNEVIKGTVSLSAALVTGDFTKMIANISMGEDFFSKDSKLSVSESTAILMHEIGHYMVYLELLGRGTTTNYILESATRRLLSAETKEIKFEIIKQIKEAGSINVSDRDALSELNRKQDIVVVLLNDAARSSHSQLGASIYDERGYEALADQFVTRMGYGRPLATGLDKVLRIYGLPEYCNFFVYSVLQIVSVAYMPVMVMYMLFGLSPNDSALYDTPKARLTAIRNDISRRLDSKRLSKEEKSTILADIDALDSLIKEVGTKTMWYTWIWNNLMPKGRKQQTTIALQKSLEQFSASRLKTSAAQLEELI